MTAYNRRGASKMSDYIANLNSTAPLPAENNDDLADLNTFASADFFDFDMAAPVDFENQQDNPSRQDSISSWNNGQSNTDLFNGDFQFADINSIPSMLSTTNAANLTPISPSTANYSIAPQGLGGLAPVTPTMSNAKRKAQIMSDPSLTLEEKTRLAAEEDKRRRNTAASARFRVKKKQREQALEKTAKEMDEKAQKLEKRVQELEMENRWLKGLITEKEGEVDIRERYATFIADGGEDGAKQEDEE